MTFLEFGLYFYIYAFLGWCLEVIYSSVKRGKFVNRGFLNGTVCPIYGFGMTLVILCLTGVKNAIFSDTNLSWFLGAAAFFACAVVMASVIEFITGFVLEKIFHTKWWDYSEEKLNIKGYVCLKFSLIWGAGGLFVSEFFHPLLKELISLLSDTAKIWIVSVLTAIIVIDFIITVAQIINHNKTLKYIEKMEKLLTVPSDAIGGAVSKITLSVVEANKKLLNSRLFKAFPKLSERLKKKKSAKTAEDKKEEPKDEVE